MKRVRIPAAIAVLFFVLAAAGCRDFSADLEGCISQGRCADDAGTGGATGGGAGGASGGGTGGTTGGGAGGSQGGGAGGGAGGSSGDGLVTIRVFPDYYLERGTVVTAVPPDSAVAGVWYELDGGSVFSPAVHVPDSGVWHATDLAPDASFLVQIEMLNAESHQWVPGVYVASSDRALDLHVAVAGRPDVAALDPTSTMNVSLSGLSPWGATDDVEIISVNSSNVFSALGPTSGVTPLDGGLPDAGGTSASLVENCVDAHLLFQIEKSKGDLAYVVQLQTLTTDSGVDIVHAVASTTVAVDFVNGGETMVSATLAPLSQSRAVRAALDLKGFEALMRGANAAFGDPVPVPGTTSGGMVIDPTYLPSSVGLIGGAPDVVLTGLLPNASDLFDLPDGGAWLDVRYGTPYPSG